MPTSVVSVRGYSLADMAKVTYVGRRMYRDKRPPIRAGSPFGNPYLIGRDGSLDDVLALYRNYVLATPALRDALPSLRGCTLGCWCVNDPMDSQEDYCYVCHAQILASLVNALCGPEPITSGLPDLRPV